MSEPKCKTCRWFSLKGNDDLGYCHRRAPVTQGQPLTNTWSFCGEHEYLPGCEPDGEFVTEKGLRGYRFRGTAGSEGIGARVCCNCQGGMLSYDRLGFWLADYNDQWVCSETCGTNWGRKHVRDAKNLPIKMEAATGWGRVRNKEKADE